MRGCIVRTTEQKLRVLTSINRRRYDSTRRIQTKAAERPNDKPQNCNSSPVKMIKTFGLRFGTHRIKLPSEVKVTLTSTCAPPPKPIAIPSFVNPKKPDAIKINDNYMLPIVPLTQPQFAKGTSGDTPSVTRVLSATMPASSQFMLEKWKESMIKKLGKEGFMQYQKDTFERGRALHAILANFLLGKGEPVAGKAELSKEVVNNLWKSIEGVVKSKISNVRLIEHIVQHPGMNYRGVVDCVACYEDELVVIDFKTAEKSKKNVESLYDNPLQISAYCGAINNDESIPRHVIDRNIVSGLVIVAYVDGSEASTYYLTGSKVRDIYWRQWILRLEQYGQVKDFSPKKTQKL